MTVWEVRGEGSRQEVLGPVAFQSAVPGPDTTELQWLWKLLPGIVIA